MTRVARIHLLPVVICFLPLVPAAGCGGSDSPDFIIPDRTKVVDGTTAALVSTISPGGSRDHRRRGLVVEGRAVSRSESPMFAAA